MTPTRSNPTLSQLKKHNPVILCLTNFVTTDFVANSVLACGASPIMSSAIEEIESLMTIASACYINTGTLNEASIERNRLAMQIANAQKKPIILDPVGAGASHLRTETNREFAPLATIIKGNASEILALCDTSSTTKGVDSQHAVSDAEHSAIQLATQHQTVVTITGEIDFIGDTEQTAHCHGGDELMTQVTGMGCALGAVMAAFAAVEPNQDYFTASVDAVAYYNHAATLAAQTASAPASFKQQFLDNLYFTAQSE